jgi:cytochrome c oxidase assembly factor 5
MSSSCKGMKEEVIACLKTSRCMVELNKTFQECLASNDEALVGDCIRVKRGFAACKRGQLDMRRRFKGNVDYNWRAVGTGGSAQ